MKYPAVGYLWLAAANIYLAGAQFQAQIAQGLQYFQAQANASVSKVTELRDAITEGDLGDAQNAYISSRIPFEQIEVLSTAFQTLACAIDCRPYAYKHGEGEATDAIHPDQLQGFHKIEALLFREGNLSAAQPYANALVDLMVQLGEVLTTQTRFNFCNWFSGALHVAFEVASRKVSGEEETYSGQSILVFYNNFVGIQEALSPFLPLLSNDTSAALQAEISASLQSIEGFVDEGESDMHDKFTHYAEVGLEEKAAIQNSAYRLAQVIQQAFDHLVEDDSVRCEGSTESGRDLPCLGAAPDDTLAAREAGARLFQSLLVYHERQVSTLVGAIAKGASLKGMQNAYLTARPLYEQFEVLAPAFAPQHVALDARPYDFDRGEFNLEFSGFHRIERFLFRDKLVGPGSRNNFTNKTLLEWATGLNDTYAQFRQKINLLPNGTEVADVFDGAVRVATDVGARKLSSEEETWSGASLMVIHNNWRGAYAQIAPLANLSSDGGQGLLAAFQAAELCLQPFITGAFPLCKMWTAEDVSAECVAQQSTFRYPDYSHVSIEDQACIVQAAYKFREAIIDIANDLGIPNSCHTFHKSVVLRYGQSKLPSESNGSDEGDEGGDDDSDEGLDGEGK